MGRYVVVDVPVDESGVPVDAVLRPIDPISFAEGLINFTPRRDYRCPFYLSCLDYVDKNMPDWWGFDCTGCPFARGEIRALGRRMSCLPYWKDTCVKCMGPVGMDLWGREKRRCRECSELLGVLGEMASDRDVVALHEDSGRVEVDGLEDPMLDPSEFTSGRNTGWIPA